MMKWMCVIALLAGCQYDETRAPGQDAAEEAVWRGLYGASGSPPSTDWVHNDRTDFLWCGNGAIVTPYQCASGFFDLTIVHVVWPDIYRVPPWADWAHEMWHAKLFQETGDADLSHRSADFWAIDGKVNRAAEMIDQQTIAHERGTN